MSSRVVVSSVVDGEPMVDEIERLLGATRLQRKQLLWSTLGLDLLEAGEGQQGHEDREDEEVPGVFAGLRPLPAEPALQYRIDDVEPLCTRHDVS